ncbi:MAG: hypothetical protein QF890_04640 [Myxococcota bacterium]|jgi:hypothetical protein|nr:hypothetical protein [Deltaproteobacteria bacterium]MCP4240649.1 hypothetical protein [bacterium]MDP6076063.1 hypothetical protein [Myxococcota bacterium]MDP6243887.1 hypothetical protein [Myxococcota bacterium]MDP7073589.1 hypothetical protein [Myxococcota bacterium]
MRTLHTFLFRGVVGGALAVAVLGAGSVRADSESCREWRIEHRGWKTQVLRKYLNGAPQREVDATVFELLQREAWLTSCDVSVRGGRDEFVGWRLVGRLPDEYGSAVVESVLERAGFALDMREVFERPRPGVEVSQKRRAGGGHVAAR